MFHSVSLFHFLEGVLHFESWGLHLKIPQGEKYISNKITHYIPFRINPFHFLEGVLYFESRCSHLKILEDEKYPTINYTMQAWNLLKVATSKVDPTCCDNRDPTELLKKDNDWIVNYPISIISSFQGRWSSRISMLLRTIPKIGNTIQK